MALRALKGSDDETEALPGWRRVAVLLASLGEDLAADLLRQMDDSEVEEITRAITEVGSVPKELRAQVVEEFEAQLEAGTLPSAGGERYAKDLLESAFGTERAQKLWNQMGSRTGESAFRLLDSADPAQVAPFIAQQHAQTIALILSQMRPDKAAGLLDRFPLQLQSDVAHRIATLERVSPDALAVLEESLIDELRDLLSGHRQVDGTKVVADILNRVGSGLERTVLNRLDSQDPEVAEQIRNQMFVFDDIARLKPKEIEIVLESVDRNELVVALKAAGKGVLKQILGVMSERRQQRLLEDLAALPPIRLSEVQQIQLRILQQLRQLEERDLIELVRGDTDETYV